MWNIWYEGVSESGKRDSTMTDVSEQITAEELTFGQWLLRQWQRADAIGELARGARRDSGFPVMGDADAVRQRMKKFGADADAMDAIDDAETDWLCI